MKAVFEDPLLFQVVITDRLNYLRHRIKQTVEVVSPNRREVDHASDQHQDQDSKECLHRSKMPVRSMPNLR